MRSQIPRFGFRRLAIKYGYIAQAAQANISDPASCLNVDSKNFRSLSRLSFRELQRPYNGCAHNSANQDHGTRAQCTIDADWSRSGASPPPGALFQLDAGVGRCSPAMAPACIRPQGSRRYGSHTVGLPFRSRTGNFRHCSVHSYKMT
jgi:hypothetical protein